MTGLQLRFFDTSKIFEEDRLKVEEQRGLEIHQQANGLTLHLTGS